jgi:hypothetical protein
MTRHARASLTTRFKPHSVSVAAMVCLLLTLVSSYDAIHIHNWVASPQDAPVAPHHCLLCLSAHLPLIVHVSPTVPDVVFSRSAALVPVEPGSYDLANTYSLYTRPPPQA